MISPFEASRIKIERAETHLNELDREINSFLGSGTVKVVLEPADEYEPLPYSMMAFTYREREPIPLSWSAIVGDVVHNLRTALDLAVSDAHRITGGNPKDASYVHYPFCKDAAYLPEMIKSRRLNGLGREFLDIIHATAPYKGGNAGLRAVHDLDGLDKHQALVPVVSVVAMDWPVPITEGDSKFRTTLVKNGQRLMVFPAPFCRLPVGSKIEAEFSMLFDVEGPFNGVPIIPQLQACGASIGHIIDLFRRAAGQNPPLHAIGSP